MGPVKVADIIHNDSDQIHGIGDQAPGDGVGDIIALLEDSLYLLVCAVADIRLVVDNPGNGSRGYAGFFCDIVNITCLQTECNYLNRFHKKKGGGKLENVKNENQPKIHVKIYNIFRKSKYYLHIIGQYGILKKRNRIQFSQYFLGRMTERRRIIGGLMEN